MTLTTAGPGATRRPRRIVQAIVWLLFAAIAVTTYCLSDAPAMSAAMAPQPAVHTAIQAAARAGDVSGPAATVVIGDTPLYGASSSPTIASTYGCSSTGQSCPDPTNLLPAYRWRTATSMPTNLGIGGHAIVYNILSSLADAMFVVASFLWWILLVVIQAAISTDMLHAAAASVDHAFSSLAGALGGTGLPVVIVVIVVAIMAARLLKGRLTGAIGLMLGALLAVGSMFGMAAAAAGSTSGAAPNTGSPAWIAMKGNDTINTLAGALTTGFGTLTDISKSSAATGGAGDNDLSTPTCSVYMGELTATYNELAKQRAQATGNSAASMTAASMTAVSSMWQRSMYQTWTQGLFGNVGSGARIACHQLETNSHTPPAEQIAIVGGEAVGNTVTSASAPGYQGMAIGPFVPTGDRDTDEGAAFAWAACLGPDQVAPGWQVTFPDFKKLATSGGDTEKAGVANCKAWYTFLSSENPFSAHTSMSIGSWVSAIFGSGFKTDYSAWGINSCAGCADAPALRWSDSMSLMNGLVWNGQADNASDPWSHREALAEVYTTVDSYWGNNGGGRLTAGFLSILSAALYMWAFGLAAVGSLIAQIGLVFLLTLLPFTLLLLALPSRGKGRGQMGKRLFTTTASFLGGKLVFLGLLSAMVQLINILWTVVNSLTGTSSSGFYMIWSLIVPLGAIIVLRLLMKALGLGNIMSVGGATGFATKAVMASTKGGRKALGVASQAYSRSRLARGKAAARGALGKAARFAGRLGMAQARGGKALADARAGRLSPGLAQAVAAGKLTVGQARAVQSGQIHPTLLRSVMDGRMGIGEALARTRTLNSIDSVHPAGGGGFDAARSRTAALAGALAGGGRAAGPVFADPRLRTGANGTALRASQDALQSLAAERGKGLGAEQYAAEALTVPAANLDRLRAGSQGVGIDAGRSLTPAEVDLERNRFAAANGIDAGRVLLGNSGAPALVAPVPRGPDGALAFDLSGTKEQLIAQAGNMANYLSLDIPVGATEAQVHLQTALTMQALGGLADDGSVSFDFLKDKTGLDAATAAGREAIIAAMRDRSGRSELDRIELSLPYQQRQAIYDLVYNNFPSSGDATVAAVTYSAAGLEDRSAVIRGQAQALAATVHSAVKRMEKMDGDSPEFASVIKQVEKTLLSVPTTYVDLRATEAEVRTAAGSVGAGRVDMGMFDALRAEFSAQADAFGAWLSRQEVALKNATGEQQRAIVELVSSRLSKEMESAGKELDDAVDGMGRTVAREAERHSMWASSQARVPVRAAAFAAGAQGLPGV